MNATWKIHLLVVFLLLFSTTPSVALTPSSLQKARLKLRDFSKHQHPSLLIVDGNNVRGCSQSRWSPWECLKQIEALRQAYDIDYSLVVWDHGPVKAIVNHSNNTVCLFAGPSKRADDLMVGEAKYIRDCFVGQPPPPHYHNVCFVTNDVGLQQRLRRLGADPSKRVKNTDGPLLLDSTRFVELAKEMECKGQESTTNRQQQAQDYIATFLQQRQGHTGRNSSTKREPTWQRCILAHSLLQGYLQETTGHVDTTIASPYFASAKERGFQTIEQLQRTDRVSPSNRLDRKQKQLLDSYNRFVLRQQKQTRENELLS